jgi:Protein of unknown function (DUF1236)
MRKLALRWTASNQGDCWMLGRIFAVTMTAVALMPCAASAEDPIGGAIAGAITGAAIATGAVVPYERREPLREYIVRENRPSYRYEDEVAVGRELPRGAYESYEVPEEYGIREHHYAIINGRPVIFHPQTRRIVHIYDWSSNETSCRWRTIADWTI